MHHDPPAALLAQLFDRRFQKPLAGNEHAVPETPEDVCPARAVPEAGAEEYDELISHRPPFPAAAAAERDIEVVYEPAVERHVPAPPELAHAAGDIRVVEVFRKLEAEEHADADGHVAVAGEIEEDLETVAHRAEPRKPHAELLRREGVYGIGDRRRALGEQELLQKAAHKTAKARRRHFRRDRVLRELRRGILPADDRPRDQAGEERKIQEERVRPPADAGWLAVHIHEIGNAVEREKRNAERQRERLRKRRKMQRFKHEREIFIKPEQRQIARRGDAAPELRPLFVLRDEPSEEIVPEKRREQHGERGKTAEAVEQRARYCKKNVLRPASRHEPVKKKRRGEKEKQKSRRIERHSRSLPSFGRYV